MQTALAAHVRRARSESRPTSIKILQKCRVASLDHNGQLQVLCLVDFTGGDGPLSYVAVFKHTGFLDEAEMPVGEGNGVLGPVSLSLEEIHHDGRLELVEQERHVDINGHMNAHADPAPTVTHISVWRNNRFILADAEFRGYFAAVVLPKLRKQLAAANVSAAHEKEVVALQGSIALANRFITKGHY